MRKLPRVSVLVCALLILLGVPPRLLYPQEGCCTGGAPCAGSEDKADGKMSACAPLKTIRGTIKAEGDKISFVNDADQKRWDVMNPEALRGQAGHHVIVSAHVYADRNAIHVMSVKVLKAKEKSSM
jgi:hypothetical protein